MLNDYCKHCEEFNKILSGICCGCLWNHLENRPATDDEKQTIVNGLDDAAEVLRRALEDDDDDC